MFCLCFNMVSHKLNFGMNFMNIISGAEYLQGIPSFNSIYLEFYFIRDWSEIGNSNGHKGGLNTHTHIPFRP